MSQSGPNLGPSWLQVVSSWAHVGPKLAPTWLKLVSCWVHFWVPSRPWANLRLSKPLPCDLLASQTPTRSKMEFKRTSQTSNLDLKPSQNTPKLNLKASLPGPQLLLAHCYYYCYSRTGGMGRSLLVYFKPNGNVLPLYAYVHVDVVRYFINALHSYPRHRGKLLIQGPDIYENI